ncbi:hypothetical protein J4Z08_21240 [Citrobacter portucalensis]|uniref:hypothetical protein n=1 Tax=Citrobacter portucalensis TaxID=1639133 RepID=UPI003140B00A
MLTPQKKRGRPKSGSAMTASTRIKEYRKRLKESGGTTINVDLDAEELALLDHIKSEWGLPESATRADLIKAMAVVLLGHTYIAGRNRISATIKISR